MTDRCIYLDNAATSFPKAPGVAEAIGRFILETGGNPGRSGHSLMAAADRAVYRTRTGLARLLEIKDPSRIAFTLNATDALNTALKGFLRPGDHVIASALEHNAVARPLHYLQGLGVSVSKLSYCAGGADPAQIADLVRPNTRLLVVTHASNVTGEVLPVAELARMAHEQEVAVLVDAAQTAGVLPLACERLGADLLAVSGHKGLLGPQGVGALYVREGVELVPLRHGGTGSRSDELDQPRAMPDHLESGTLSGPCIAGLGAALAWLEKRTVEGVREHELALTGRLLAGLRDIPDIVIYGPREAEHCVGVTSFNLRDATGAIRDPSDLARQLEERHGILCRPGLHCAPLAHEAIGTLGTGTVRLSLSVFTTHDEVDATVEGIRAIAQSAS